MTDKREFRKAVWKAGAFLVVALAALGMVIAGAVTEMRWIGWVGFGLCWVIVIVSVRNLYLILKEVNRE